MIEYIFNTIKASAGNDIDVVAKITNDDGSPITLNCSMMLFDEEEGMIADVKGNYIDENWVFSIPAEATEGRVGKHWYCVCYGSQNLCFREPLYLV